MFYGWADGRMVFVPCLKRVFYGLFGWFYGWSSVLFFAWRFHELFHSRMVFTLLCLFTCLFGFAPENRSNQIKTSCGVYFSMTKEEIPRSKLHIQTKENINLIDA